MNISKPRRVAIVAKSFAGAMFAGVIAFSAPAYAQDSDKVIATVDGEQITEKDLDLAKVLLGEQLEQIPEDQRRSQLIQLLVDTMLLANAAEREGARETDAYKRRIKFLDLRALRDTYVDQQVRSKISDDDVKARYEAEIVKLKPEEEIKASHILLLNEADANEVIKELDKGADFAELAKSKSTGPSGPNGGDLGYFTKGRMVPAFEAAAFALKPGEYTKKPIQTQFGWHVIKVDDKRQSTPPPAPPLEQVAEQIRRIIANERYAALMKGLRDKAKVQISDK